MDFDNCGWSVEQATAQGTLLIIWLTFTVVISFAAVVFPAATTFSKAQVEILSGIQVAFSIGMLFMLGIFGSGYHTAETCDCPVPLTPAPPMLWTNHG